MKVDAQLWIVDKKETVFNNILVTTICLLWLLNGMDDKIANI